MSGNLSTQCMSDILCGGVRQLDKSADMFDAVDDKLLPLTLSVEASNTSYMYYSITVLVL
jgi:hypothetical protein